MSRTAIRSIVRAGLAAASLAIASPADAQRVATFDREFFNALVDRSTVNDLDLLANGSTVVSFGTFGTGTLVGASVTDGRIANTGSPFTFEIRFSQLLNGFGADFSNGFGGPAAATYTFFNGDTQVDLMGLYGGTTGFLGSITFPFDRVQVSEIPVPGNGATLFASLDNLTVAVIDDGVSTVPEPATVVLMGVGLLVVGGASYRRRRPG